MKKNFFFWIFLTSDPLGVILCKKSIARIPEPWKRFLDPDLEKESVYWSENFPESRSRKRFQGSGMRAIDFSHKITPKRSLVKKIQKKIFFIFAPVGWASIAPNKQ